MGDHVALVVSPGSLYQSVVLRTRMHAYIQCVPYRSTYVSKNCCSDDFIFDIMWRYSFPTANVAVSGESSAGLLRLHPLPYPHSPYKIPG